MSHCPESCARNVLVTGPESFMLHPSLADEEASSAIRSLRACLPEEESAGLSSSHIFYEALQHLMNTDKSSTGKHGWMCMPSRSFQMLR